MSLLVNKIIADNEINFEEKQKYVREILQAITKPIRKVLIVPPDFTRFHSKAGEFTRILYDLLKEKCQIDIIPALGTHSPLTRRERQTMFGNIPQEQFKVHNWRENVLKIGEIPSTLVEEVTKGKLSYSIDVEVNKHITDKKYDIIFSLGQVVPHEVAGMANGNKNILVGLGGRDFINKTHFLGAVCGIEGIMGRSHNPVRTVFNYAEDHFLRNFPIIYILTVISQGNSGEPVLRGLFAGDTRQAYNQAAQLSQRSNIKVLEKPLQKIVVYLDPNEFKSTWLGNKAIYRTRMAIADDGQLVVLAPGVTKFGEDPKIDSLIRTYGYVPTEKVLEAVRNNNDLRNNLSAAAHLIHGSCEGRFRIVYCPGGLTKKEITEVNYRYADQKEMMKKYNPTKLKDGFNVLADGETCFFIRNPAIGLWSLRNRFE